MADSAADGRIRIASVPSIANIAAPTVAELNAGVDLSLLVTPDGLMGLQPETADVDNASINSTADTTIPGRIKYSGMGLKLKKQIGTDTVYNTLVYNFTTNLVVRRDLPYTTAWTTSQPAEVYPVICGEVQNQDPAPNEMHKYIVPLKNNITANLRAVVA
jgi:hypothetical protein